MADIIDINALRKEFDEKTKTKDLKAFAESQYQLIIKLMDEAAIHKTKIKQLETTINLLPKKISLSNVSPEEMICIEQIAMLKVQSASRNLTLEETKKLDILIKSLKLIRDDAPKEQNSSVSSSTGEDELVAIASGKANI